MMSLVTINLFILLCSPPTIPASDIFKAATKVTVKNNCTGTEEKFLANNGIHKSPPDSSGKVVYKLGSSEGDSYPIVICTETQCYRYGNMTFLSGREYDVEISGCDLPGVKIESHEVKTSTNKTTVQIRFRSRRVSATEYRHGQTRFRRLSVGMSRYWDLSLPEQEKNITVQFRYRAISTGPVSYMSTHILSNLKAGRRYFIEVEYFGNKKEIIKIQDEGKILEKPKRRKSSGKK